MTDIPANALIVVVEDDVFERMGASERWPRVGIIMASGRPRPHKLPLSMLFHDKPYAPAAVLRQAREMTSQLG